MLKVTATDHFKYFRLEWRGNITTHVRDGRFELHGVDREKANTVHFLDDDDE